MAELQASFDIVESGAQSNWRYALPDGRDVTIGRNRHTDVEVPEWNRADWVVMDPRISGRHAVVCWDGEALRVRRRQEPRPASNPVFYKGTPNDDFKIRPGESFTIGSTTFTLHDQEVGDGSDSSEPDQMTMTVGREELRRSTFLDAQTPLMALAGLPELVRNCHDEAQLEERVLDVVLKGLPLAEFAGFARLDPTGGREARAGITRSKQRGLPEHQFHLSHRLVRHALRDVMESVLYIWDQKMRDVPFSATMTPNADWAICSPLGENPQGRVLYVAGRVPRHIHSEEELRRDREFQDYQKFVNLAADLCSSMGELRCYQERFEQMRRFLPRRMVALLAQQNLDVMLKPRLAEVTALFCDLRGSSLYAEDTSDMLASWKRMSAALDIMTSAIDEYEGVIGGLQGDAAVGFWGWPASAPDQIDRALRAAQRIRREFARNKELRSDFNFQCGIGLAHGTAIVGRLGVFDHFKLDAYGPVMNLAARLESMTKQFGVQVLMNAAVAEYAAKNDPDGSRGRVRRLAKVQPAGMTAGIEISELMLPAVDAESEDANIPYNQWDIGVRFFIEGNWAQARRQLQRYLNGLPQARTATEKAAHLLLAFMDRTVKPPEGWDGTIPMDTK
jgi:adenylate cyclase